MHERASAGIGEAVAVEREQHDARGIPASVSDERRLSGRSQGASLPGQHAVLGDLGSGSSSAASSSRRVTRSSASSRSSSWYSGSCFSRTSSGTSRGTPLLFFSSLLIRVSRVDLLGSIRYPDTTERNGGRGTCSPCSDEHQSGLKRRWHACPVHPPLGCPPTRSRELRVGGASEEGRSRGLDPRGGRFLISARLVWRRKSVVAGLGACDLAPFAHGGHHHLEGMRISVAVGDHSRGNQVAPNIPNLEIARRIQPQEVKDRGAFGDGEWCCLAGCGHVEDEPW